MYNNSSNGSIKVTVEHDEENQVVYIRNKSDGHYLTAHENCKHVYWTEPNDDIWTWEQFSLDDDTNALVTSEGMHLWYNDDDETMWQCDSTDGVITLKKDSDEDSEDEENDDTKDSEDEENDDTKDSEDEENDETKDSEDDEDDTKDSDEEEEEEDTPPPEPKKKMKNKKSDEAPKKNNKKGADAPKKKTKKDDEPNKKKREATPLMKAVQLFYKATLDKVKKKQPGLKYPEYKKIMGAMWNELSQKKKDNWIAEVTASASSSSSDEE